MTTKATFTPREPTVEELKNLWDVVGAVLHEVENAPKQPDTEAE